MQHLRCSVMTALMMKNRPLSLNCGGIHYQKMSVPFFLNKIPEVCSLLVANLVTWQSHHLFVAHHLSQDCVTTHSKHGPVLKVTCSTKDCSCVKGSNNCAGKKSSWLQTSIEPSPNMATVLLSSMASFACQCH